MRKRRWYSRFGIEPPFPWPAFFWPFIWVYFVVVEGVQK